MKIRRITVSVFFSLFSLSSMALSADNLGQFDARSTAMGGAGVAGADSANAAAYNPALIATDGSEKHFSIIPLVLNVQAYDDNNFMDNIDKADKAINGNGSLDDLMISINGTADNCGPPSPCYTNPAMIDLSLKAQELNAIIDELGKSHAKVTGNTGAAIQISKTFPMALVFDTGVITSVGLKFSPTDLAELNAYASVMADGTIDSTDYAALDSLGLVSNICGSNLCFSRIIDANKELHSLLEVIGARYTQLGLSLAHNFDMGSRKVALGVTPKIIKVDAVKYHQDVEAQDISASDVFNSDNMLSKTDFNTDLGMTIKPFKLQPLKVGLTLKNLFTKTYELKKTPEQLNVENNGYPEASTDLAAFNFRNELKIEPQLTAGIAYTLPFVHLLADVDLNEAEVLGKTTQHLSAGAEFSVKVFKIQVGHTVAIGGDNEEDSSSAGFSVGFLDVAATFQGNHVGGVIQTSFSF